MIRIGVIALALVPPLGCGGGDHVAHWGYGPDDGPARWGSLSPEWTTCDTGRSQSPLDIRDTKVTDISRLSISLPTTDKRIIAHQDYVVDALDNGHTIQVDVNEAETLTFDGQTYDLLQYHFHAPSEHTVEGKHFAMELHFVHQADNGDLAVVGTFIEEGEHHADFETVWSQMPEKGKEVHIEHFQVDIDQLLPDDLRHWRYSGSLTTPPCSEHVRWFLLQTPMQLDAEQIQEFKDLFPDNNRPTQPLNGREVLIVNPSL